MLLNVVEGIHCDQTPMPLVIFETRLYLDRLHHHPDKFFSGSLLLLQVDFWTRFFSSLIEATVSFSRRPDQGDGRINPSTVWFE